MSQTVAEFKAAVALHAGLDMQNLIVSYKDAKLHDAQLLQHCCMQYDKLRILEVQPKDGRLVAVSDEHQEFAKCVLSMASEETGADLLVKVLH